MSGADDFDPQLAFTVAAVWRRERISCPHPDWLSSWMQDGLSGGAAEFVRFHLEESACPYCNAVLSDLKAREDEAKKAPMQDLKDRLLRSTVTALRERRR
jgi:hypothetical protein